VRLNELDWLIVMGSIVAAFIPALLLTRRAGRGTAEFFVSGRSAPWWLIGTSMVATTFSTDTPNLVTDFVRTGGVAKNWSWWAFLLTGMTTVFFYSRLWRRSGVLTDLEFYELRYSGAPAAFLRGFRAIYLGLFFNCVIMASVTLAATKIASIMLGWPAWQTVLVGSVLCIGFAVLSGLWGVLASDLIQFVIAMIGVIASAWVALSHPQVGGLSGLLQQLRPETLRMAPDFGDGEAVLGLLIIPLAVQWWSVWYPGAEPGGGSYIAQRILAARNERHALGATLWFNLAHYAIRPWPWIIVALCSMVVFPELADIKARFPHVPDALLGDDMAYPAMLTFLPHGLLGLLVASLLSAYISTMSTHLNWGASYLVHDFYQRFVLRRGGGGDSAGEASGETAGGVDRPLTFAEERHLVGAARVVTVLLMGVSGAITFALTTAGEAFNLMLSIGAGTGLIYLLRWYWWRVNAWSEIAGMCASFAAAVGLFVAQKSGYAVSAHRGLLLSVGFTTVVWLLTTFLTRPESKETLLRFVRRVRPAGPGWSALRRAAEVEGSPDDLNQAGLCALLGCVMVYGALLGVGSVIYGSWVSAAVCGVGFVGGALGLWMRMRSAPARRV